MQLSMQTPRTTYNTLEDTQKGSPGKQKNLNKCHILDLQFILMLLLHSKTQTAV